MNIINKVQFQSFLRSWIFKDFFIAWYVHSINYFCMSKMYNMQDNVYLLLVLSIQYYFIFKRGNIITYVSMFLRNNVNKYLPMLIEFSVENILKFEKYVSAK